MGRIADGGHDDVYPRSEVIWGIVVTVRVRVRYDASGDYTSEEIPGGLNFFVEDGHLLVESEGRRKAASYQPGIWLSAEVVERVTKSALDGITPVRR